MTAMSRRRTIILILMLRRLQIAASEKLDGPNFEFENVGNGPLKPQTCCYSDSSSPQSALRHVERNRECDDRNLCQSVQAQPPALNMQSVNDRNTFDAITALDSGILKGHSMAKGKNSQKETKKPKKEKLKVSATAGSQNGKPALSITGKK